MTDVTPNGTPSPGELSRVIAEFKNEVRSDLADLKDHLDNKVVSKEVWALEKEALQKGIDSLRHLINRAAAALGTASVAALSAWLYSVLGRH